MKKIRRFSGRRMAVLLTLTALLLTALITGCDSPLTGASPNGGDTGGIKISIGSPARSTILPSIFLDKNFKIEEYHLKFYNDAPSNPVILPIEVTKYGIYTVNLPQGNYSHVEVFAFEKANSANNIENDSIAYGLFNVPFTVDAAGSSSLRIIVINNLDYYKYEHYNRIREELGIPSGYVGLPTNLNEHIWEELHWPQGDFEFEIDFETDLYNVLDLAQSSIEFTNFGNLAPVDGVDDIIGIDHLHAVASVDGKVTTITGAISDIEPGIYELFIKLHDTREDDHIYLHQALHVYGNLTSKFKWDVGMAFFEDENIEQGTITIEVPDTSECLEFLPHTVNGWVIDTPVSVVFDDLNQILTLTVNDTSGKAQSYTWFCSTGAALTPTKDTVTNDTLAISSSDHSIFSTKRRAYYIFARSNTGYQIQFTVYIDNTTSWL